MCSQRQKPVRKNPPFSHLFIWDTVRNCPMTVQDAVKMQRVSFHLHFGNEDTDMEQHSAHNNTCKTQKFHYTTNTQQPVQMLLGNESKRHIKCTVGGLFGLLLCISVILMGRCLQWGRGEPNCIHKWNFNFLSTI